MVSRWGDRFLTVECEVADSKERRFKNDPLVMD